MMKMLKELQIGEAFKRKASAKGIYTRGHYVPGRKGEYPSAYQCNDWDDINRAIYLKGETIVFTDFEY